MAEVKRVGDLEISEDTRFQQRQWSLHRIAWALLVALLVLAGLGLFSSGPISQTSRASKDSGLTLDYERYLRFGKPTEVSLELERARGETELTVEAEYLAGFSIERVSPEPDSVRSARDRLIYSFEAPPSQVTFSLTPREVGGQEGSFSLKGAERLSLSQFVYP